MTSVDPWGYRSPVEHHRPNLLPYEPTRKPWTRLDWADFMFPLVILLAIVTGLFWLIVWVARTLLSN